MSKLTIALALAAFVYYVHANPAPEPNPHFDDEDDSFFDNDFAMPTMKPFVFPTMRPMLTKEDIENLHPKGANDHVKGTSESHSSSMKVVNGKVVKDTSYSEKVDNDNGKVTKQSSGSGD